MLLLTRDISVILKHPGKSCALCTICFVCKSYTVRDGPSAARSLRLSPNGWKHKDDIGPLKKKSRC